MRRCLRHPRTEFNVFELPWTDDHRTFRTTVQRFMRNEIEPHHEAWENDGVVPRDIWRKAGELGLLLTSTSDDWGGAGDFLYSVIVTEELANSGATGPMFYLHSDMIAPYLEHHASDELRAQWLPKMATGEAIAAVAMTEPGAGSDLQGIQTRAVRDGDEWVIRGQKTFISNGQLADIIVVAARTPTETQPNGISLFLVEADRPGFSRGRNLEKVGLHAQDTSELVFDEVRVPLGNLIGEQGRGFGYLMSELPQERLMIAIYSLASAEAAVRWTTRYVEDRTAFGKPLSTLQNTRFKLAEARTEAAVTRSFVDQCIAKHLHKKLDTAEASMAKYWATEMQFRVLDTCMQLFGGYGYMREYPIARAWADARVMRIYGGTSEIMKEIIARSMFPKR